MTVLLIVISSALWLKIVEVILHMIRTYPLQDSNKSHQTVDHFREWPITSIIDRMTIRFPRIVRRVVFRFKVLTILLIITITSAPLGNAALFAGTTLYLAIWIQLARILVDQAKYGSAAYLGGIALPNPLLPNSFGGQTAKHRLRAFLQLFLGLCGIVVLGYAALYCLSFRFTNGKAFSGVPNDGWMFVHFVYFSIVTLGTVGYGDMAPAPCLIPRVIVGSQIVAGFLVLVALVTSVSLTFQEEHSNEES